jgi:hypothetical protein
VVTLTYFHQVEAIWSQSGMPAQTAETESVFHVGQPFNTQQSGAETMEAWSVGVVFLEAFRDAAKKPKPAQCRAKEG